MHERARRTGRALPALATMPSLPDHLSLEWEAFWSLDGDRSTGFSSVGRIPFTAIERYAARLGLTDPDAFRRFRVLIQRMDAAYLAHLAKRRPQPGK
ncbi:hypothetical protein DFO45_2300 [Azorhizobium sp. AG788]|uniref:phage tail assembly chaperone n=1 Tax=Azorhizobium sp. AG788 TaxID=2183897 RepID=UPI00105CBCC3|nr:hypothetical protein [Azorhizobium sp. AG788]TDT94550.1 hypothetical protein DFO45_2300 [Azorhizobium sp. AG788]